MKCFYAVVVGLLSWGPVAPALGQEQAGGTVKTFTYKKATQADLEMHVHFPPGWKAEDKRPAIVFFFGGGWEQGSVKGYRTRPPTWRGTQA
jgi:hypothetical protein